jgi:hypothetical protein
VNRCFNDIGQFIIYTSLSFKSESQLVGFVLIRRLYARHHTRYPHHHHSHHKDEHQEGTGGPAAVGRATLAGGASTVRHDMSSDTAVKRLLPHSPRSISVRIPGGQGGGIVFEGIRHVFALCAEEMGTSVLALDSLEFCLHSHTSDPAPWRIGEALSLVKCVPHPFCPYAGPKLTRGLPNFLVSPRKFVWTGPDPPHHFSTAVRLSSIRVPTW